MNKKTLNYIASYSTLIETSLKVGMSAWTFWLIGLLLAFLARSEIDLFIQNYFIISITTLFGFLLLITSETNKYFAHFATSQKTKEFEEDVDIATKMHVETANAFLHTAVFSPFYTYIFSIFNYFLYLIFGSVYIIGEILTAYILVNLLSMVSILYRQHKLKYDATLQKYNETLNLK